MQLTPQYFFTNIRGLFMIHSHGISTLGVATDRKIEFPELISEINETLLKFHEPAGFVCVCVLFPRIYGRVDAR